MAEGYKVERQRLRRHAAWLERQRDEWASAIPADLDRLYTNGAEFTTVGADLAAALDGLRTKYANDTVPRLSGLMNEVVMALYSVERNYGDAEEAATVARQGDRFPQAHVPADALDHPPSQGLQ